MAITILRWPNGLDYKLIDLAIDWRSQSPGKSVLGSEQVTLSQADAWTARVDFPTLSFNRMEGRVQVPIYRAFIATLKGRYRVFKLPVYDAWFGYGEENFGIPESVAWGGQPFSDGTYWGDNTGWDYTTTIDNVLVAGAAQGASEIVANFGTYGQLIHVGQYFTLNTYLYIVKDVFYHTNGDAYIQIEPPLRVAATGPGGGTPATFEWPPYLVGRFVEDLTGRHELDFGIFTAPSLTVEEFRER